MRQMTTLVLAMAVMGFAGVAATPTAAEAQCHWGCTCEGNACGCNRNGSGSKCDNGGTGCVVTGCGTELETGAFAPDGSFATLAAAPAESTSAGSEGDDVDGRMSGGYRWEFAAPGYSVARHCSGVVLARYFDRAAAAAVRERTASLTL